MSNGYTDKEILEKMWVDVKELRNEVHQMITKLYDRIDNIEKKHIIDNAKLSEKINKYKNSIVVSIIIAVPALIGGVIAITKFIK